MASILIIEDKESMRKMLSKTLESEGYEVEAFGDGPAAIDKAKEKKFDLVLTDLKLPNADGIDVLKNIKEIDPDISVIVMTAFGTIERGLTLGPKSRSLGYHSLDHGRIRDRQRAFCQGYSQFITPSGSPLYCHQLRRHSQRAIGK